MIGYDWHYQFWWKKKFFMFIFLFTFTFIEFVPPPLPDADDVFGWPVAVDVEFVPLLVPLFAPLPIAVGPTPVMKRWKISAFLKINWFLFVFL